MIYYLMIRYLYGDNEYTNAAIPGKYLVELIEIERPGEIN